MTLISESTSTIILCLLVVPPLCQDQPGFKERFEDEIFKKAEHTAKTDINVFADLHRKNAAWIGGSMLASFSTFKDMTIKKDEYDNSTESDKSTAIGKKSIN